MGTRDPSPPTADISRTITTVARHRIILTLATGLALTMTAAPAAVASPQGSDREAAAVLATADPDQPLTVVTTTQTASGPQFTTKTVDSRSEALGVVSDALDEPGTTAVGMAHPISIAGVTDGVSTTATAGTATKTSAAAVAKKKRTNKRANDTLRSQQRALNRLGAEKVWRKSSGRGAVVAVIDSGVQANHPDLKGRVLRGRDFVDGDRSANDLNGHGTHVAGTIAARANNRRGIAGLAPSARILPVRVLDSAGNGNTYNAARGIVWAVSRGADVINLSFAGNQIDPQMQAAVDYAVRHDVVVVAAAGNQGCSGPTTYPAALPGVIGVAASNRHDRIAPFSTCGPAVDVSAPGQSIKSTMIKRPSAGLPCSYGKNYCQMSGTSMASPHVAAAAAIIISRTKHRLSAWSVGSLITTRADNLGVAGYDLASGNGLLNIRRALTGR
jgi:subtilisin family serine protease